MNARFRKVDDILDSMAVRRFFTTRRVGEFVPHYMSNGTLVLTGKKVKNGLESLMPPIGPLDANTLTEEGFVIFPKTLALLAYIEGYRDSQIIY